MNKAILIGVLLAVWLAGCAPNPIDVAEARRMDALTEQDVLDREQSRGFRVDAEARQAEREAAAVEREIQREAEEEGRRSRVWEAATAGAELAAGLASFLIVTAFGVGMATLFVGLGQAMRDAALLKANSIPLDFATRQYPLLRQWVGEDGRRLTMFGKGVYTLSNPNDGSVTRLDARRDGDPQKIAGMISAWDAGLVAEAARGAKESNSDGVAMTTPLAGQVIEASSRYLEARDGK